MTFQITAADVGRVAVDRGGDEHTIVMFQSNYERPVVTRCKHESVGAYTESGEHPQRPNLIRFADEPKPKPPETVTLKFDDRGHIYGYIDDVRIGHNGIRTDLAGQTFTYEIRRG